LAITDDPNVQKALAWLQANRPLVYESVQSAIAASWARTAAPHAPVENAPEMAPADAASAGDDPWASA